MSKKIAVLILFFTFLPVINAQNPSADWVMLFKYRIITEAISKDGSGFVAVTESEEGNNKSVIIHLKRILNLNDPANPKNLVVFHIKLKKIVNVQKDLPCLTGLQSA